MNKNKYHYNSSMKRDLALSVCTCHQQCTMHRQRLAFQVIAFAALECDLKFHNVCVLSFPGQAVSHIDMSLLQIFVAVATILGYGIYNMVKAIVSSAMAVVQTYEQKPILPAWIRAKKAPVGVHRSNTCSLCVTSYSYSAARNCWPSSPPMSLHD